MNVASTAASAPRTAVKQQIMTTTTKPSHYILQSPGERDNCKERAARRWSTTIEFLIFGWERIYLTFVSFSCYDFVYCI